MFEFARTTHGNKGDRGEFGSLRGKIEQMIVYFCSPRSSSSPIGFSTQLQNSTADVFWGANRSGKAWSSKSGLWNFLRYGYAVHSPHDFLRCSVKPSSLPNQQEGEAPSNGHEDDQPSQVLGQEPESNRPSLFIDSQG